MQILFHLGAHCTDDGLLIRSILRNRAVLAEQGIGVPGPGRYRELIGEVSTRLRGAVADETTEAMLIEAIRDDDTAIRIVLSNDNFLCRPKAAVSEEGLYPKAGKSAWLRNCFPGHDVEFAIGLRHPARFVPALLAALGDADRDALRAALRPDRLIWADAVAEIVEANPGSRIFVWRDEDTPFIWSELMAELTGHDPYTRLDGAFDGLARHLTPEGVRRLEDFAARHPGLTEARRRRVAAAFLEAHALGPAVPPDTAMPEWAAETAARLTESYEDDITQIAAFPGVTLIAP